jgi:hypothetical protein
MLFTPGRIIGLLVFLAVLIAVGYLLKRLQDVLGPSGEETGGAADGALALETASPREHAAPTAPSPKAGHHRSRKRGR